MAAVYVLLGLCLVGGAAVAALGARDLIRSPEWHLTATHAVRTRGSRVLRVIDLRGAPPPVLTPIHRYGRLVSVRVDIGKRALVAPSTDVANAVVSAWRDAQSPR